MKTIIIDGVEYNLTPKVAFREGDWVVNTITNDVEQIIEVTSNEYICTGLLIVSFDNQHLLKKWTIQDAKDGDVLVWDDSKCIALFKNVYDEDNFNSYGFIGHCTGKFEVSPNYHSIEGAHPASKERRDLLFQKMKEAGYEWDAEKKELKKIERKTAWSKEDDEILDTLIADYEFLSKKYRDEEHDFFVGMNLVKEDLDMIDWLKSLKDRVQPQPKQEWNEDTQQWIDAIIKDYEEWYKVNKDHRATIQIEIDILKSLKERYAWKPSEEQLEALDDFIYSKYPNTEKHGAAVKSLYQDLKKL